MHAAAVPGLPLLLQYLLLALPPQAQLYDENLALDLAPWRARGRANVSIGAMAGDWMAGQPAKASQRVVVVRGGRVLLVDAKGRVSYECERPCDRILYETVECESGLWGDAGLGGARGVW